jgi:hypothetical protein
MAIISASTMIRSISLFHVALAVILLRNPSMISNQGVVLLLGESMQLVSVTYTASQKPQWITNANAP